VEKAWELAALMSDRDEISVSAGSDGISVSAKGSAATRLGHSVADAIRFFSSPMGLAADEIDRMRIHRQISFEKTLLQAHGVSIERGLETSKVPMKFLAQWGESASLEDMDDPENLSLYWANLLISEATGVEPNSLIYADILKKLNRSHVEYLNDLIGGSFPSAVGNPSIIFGQRNVDNLVREAFHFEEVTGTLAVSKLPKTELLDAVEKINALPGLELMTLSSTQSPPESSLLYEESKGLGSDGLLFEYIKEEDADCEGDRPDLIFSSLAALNLVEIRLGRVEVFLGFYFRYSLTLLTPLGWDFLRACSTKP